jgi:hypothetical protein
MAQGGCLQGISLVRKREKKENVFVCSENKLTALITNISIEKYDEAARM